MIELTLIRQESKDRDICHYWYFLEKGFKFQLDVYNGYHDLLVMSMNLSDIAILSIHGTNCCCIVSRINKNEGVNLMQNMYLTKVKIYYHI